MKDFNTDRMKPGRVDDRNWFRLTGPRRIDIACTTLSRWKGDRKGASPVGQTGFLGTSTLRTKLSA